MRTGVKCFGIIILLSTWAWAENWPHWRGPDRDGVSPETNLPVEWSATENVTWKVPMTAWSGATPIIWGDYIFLNAAEGGKRTPPRHGRRRRKGEVSPLDLRLHRRLKKRNRTRMQRNWLSGAWIETPGRSCGSGVWVEVTGS